MIEPLVQAILEQVEKPKKDIEHNVRALLSEAIEKLDLVSKQELERQKIALEHANRRLEALKQQLDQFEQRDQNPK